jgi:hypothetical protein
VEPASELQIIVCVSAYISMFVGLFVYKLRVYIYARVCMHACVGECVCMRV